MTIELYRVDDRLIHGQVVVGWGQPLGLSFIAVVDDSIAASEWEQELYRMAVPPEVEVAFASVADAAAALARWQTDRRPGLLLSCDIATMCRLVSATERAGARIPAINLGGVHCCAGRVERLSYLYLSPAEEDALRALAARGVAVSARDVPAARAVPLAEVLDSRGSA